MKSTLSQETVKILEEEIFEGRNANREEERDRRLGEVRLTINFNNTNYDNEDNVEQTPKQTETKQDFENSNIQDTENNDNENANIESSNLEKDGARSQQLQDTDRKDQDPVEPTGDPVHLVFGDSNATRVHFKHPAVFNISQP